MGCPRVTDAPSNHVVFRKHHPSYFSGHRGGSPGSGACPTRTRAGWRHTELLDAPRAAFSPGRQESVHRYSSFLTPQASIEADKVPDLRGGGCTTKLRNHGSGFDGIFLKNKINAKISCRTKYQNFKQGQHWYC